MVDVVVSIIVLDAGKDRHRAGNGQVGVDSIDIVGADGVGQSAEQNVSSNEESSTSKAGRLRCRYVSARANTMQRFQAYLGQPLILLLHVCTAYLITLVVTVRLDAFATAG